jgi:phosphohistidine phosphatase
MIEQLYILRHGIAVPHGTPGIADDDRPLTPKGEDRMREIGKGLAKLDLGIERIVTSPLPRARRTAEIVAGALKMRDTLEDADALRSGADPAAIRDWLRGRPESRLMIVGHNPALSDLVDRMVLGDSNAMLVDVKKGGIAALVRAGGSGDRYRIEWIATPGLLRRLS